MGLRAWALLANRRAAALTRLRRWVFLPPTTADPPTIYEGAKGSLEAHILEAWYTELREEKEL